MDDNFSAGLAILLGAGIVNASFPLPLKYTRVWKWENTWLLFSILALLAIPWVVGTLAVPNLAAVYRAVAAADFVPGLVFGFLWGLAQVTFGISFGLVGMAMAFAIVVGMGAVVGSFVPMAVLQPEDLLGPRGRSLMIAAAILTAGLIVYARAARQRERDTNPGAAAKAASHFRKGLAVCIFTGAFGAMINLGFAFSGAISQRATALGASPLSATFAVWPIVLTGGFLPNLAYTMYLLRRNRTVGCFSRSAGREALLGIAMAALWIGGVFGYGLGAATMGRFGTSIGYAVYVIVMMLWSTTLGVMTGEWRGVARGTYRRMQIGVAILLASVLVLSLPGLW